MDKKGLTELVRSNDALGVTSIREANLEINFLKELHLLE
jgi:hypothetical protein